MIKLEAKEVDVSIRNSISKSLKKSFGKKKSLTKKQKALDDDPYETHQKKTPSKPTQAL